MKNKLHNMFETFIVCVVTIFVLIFGIFMQDVNAAPVEDVIAADIAGYNGNTAQVYWIRDAICYASSMYQVDPLLVQQSWKQKAIFPLILSIQLHQQELSD